MRTSSKYSSFVTDQFHQAPSAGSMDQAHHTMYTIPFLMTYLTFCILITYFEAIDLFAVMIVFKFNYL